MKSKGDAARQAEIRDGAIKRRVKADRDPYISGILSILGPGMRLCDIGCGTGHVIGEIAEKREGATLIGLDISSDMLEVASSNTQGMENVMLVEGDGFELPFRDSSFDITINRLSEYSPGEAFRTLRRGGTLFVYGLGPDADREIRDCFQERVEEENFFLPKDPQNWKEEVCQDIENEGFEVISVKDYMEMDYYRSNEEIMDLIEMVPLVKGFDRRTDRKAIEELMERHEDDKGVGITWHYYILQAERP